MPAIPTGASASLGLPQQFQGNSLQALLQQQNNDMLVKQRRVKTKTPLDPAEPYSSSASYRALLGLGGI